MGKNTPIIELIHELTALEFGLDPDVLEWAGTAVRDFGKDAQTARLVALALCPEFMSDLKPELLRDHFNAPPGFARYSAKTWLPGQKPDVKARAERLRGKIKLAMAVHAAL